MWSLFVPVHVKILPKVKLDQVEIDSNIAKNHFHSSQEVISAHYLHKFIGQIHMITCKIQEIQSTKHSITLI